jgi:hypothetical protein
VNGSRSENADGSADPAHVTPRSAAMAEASEPPKRQFFEPGWGVGQVSELDAKVPDEINGMKVTSELRAMYAGFPELLVM